MPELRRSEELNVQSALAYEVVQDLAKLAGAGAAAHPASRMPEASARSASHIKSPSLRYPTKPAITTFS